MTLLEAFKRSGRGIVASKEVSAHYMLAIISTGTALCMARSQALSQNKPVHLVYVVEVTPPSQQLVHDANEAAACGPQQGRLSPLHRTGHILSAVEFTGKLPSARCAVLASY